MFFRDRFQEESALLRQLFFRYRKWIFMGVSLLFILAGLETLPPLLIKRVIDEVSAPSGSVDRFSVQRWITFAAVAYLGIALVQAVCRFGWRMLLVRASMSAGRDLRLNLSEQLFRLPIHFFDQNKVGDLMSLANSDVEAVRMALGAGVIVLADAFLYLLAIPAIMFWIAPKLAFLCMIPLPLITWLVIRNEKRVHDRYLEVQNSYSKLAAEAQENLAGASLVKGFAVESQQFHRFHQEGVQFIQKNLSLARVQSSFGPSLDLSMSAGVVALLYFGGSGVLDGAVSVGTFVAFQRYVQKLIWPMSALGMAVVYFQRALVSSSRIQSVLKRTPELTAEELVPGNASSAELTSSIEIRNLTFTYPGTKDAALKNISLKIKAGERIAITGPMGSGKTTLVSLLARLYDVPQGTIFFDGIDINEIPIERLRRKVGFVPQDQFLMSETVLQNIAFGLGPESGHLNNQGDIHKAAQVSQVHREILELPEGYHTRLGERGSGLSGGQRQRVTVARALALNPSVLVLDDALSAIDYETEKKLLDDWLGASLSRQGEVTEIWVTHRPTVQRFADRVLVLEEGRLVSSEALKQSGPEANT